MCVCVCVCAQRPQALTAADEVGRGLLLLGTAHGSLLAARAAAGGFQTGVLSAGRAGRWVTKVCGLPLHRLALAGHDDGLLTLLT